MRTRTVNASAVVILAIAMLVLAASAYRVVRWSDPDACPGIQAIDPTCTVIRD